MIFKSTSRISPTIDFVVDGVPMRYMSIVQMILELSENQHDMLRVRVAGIPPRLLTEYLNKPVYAYWGMGINKHEFCGYIASVEPTYMNSGGVVNGSPFQVVELVCAGASYAMRAKRNRLWTNTPLQTIATTLANEYRFSVSCVHEPYAFPRLVQSGESDWEFLNKVVDAYGLSMSMHGTHLHIWNPMNALGRATSYHDLKNIKARNGDTAVLPATILSMKGMFGETILPSTSHGVTFTVVEDRGMVYTVDHSHDGEVTGFGKTIDFGITDELSANVTSAQMAETLAKAYNRGIGSLTARLSLTGTAGMLPGGIVSISNFDSNFDGFWYVKEVCHTATQDEFFTDLLIARKDTSDTEPFMTIQSKAPDIPRPAFIGNAWAASTQLEDLYV